MADTKLVFDADAWRKAGGDVGDNSCFWKKATILSTDGEIATVRFEHDQRVSYGHFIDNMKDVPLPPCEWCGSTFHGHHPNCPDLER